MIPVCSRSTRGDNLSEACFPPRVALFLFRGFIADFGKFNICRKMSHKCQEQTFGTLNTSARNLFIGPDPYIMKIFQLEGERMDPGAPFHHHLHTGNLHLVYLN